MSNASSPRSQWSTVATVSLALVLAVPVFAQEKVRIDGPAIANPEQFGLDVSIHPAPAAPSIDKSVPVTQQWTRNDGSLPMMIDWSNKHVAYPAGYTQEQYNRMQNDPRAFANWMLHGTMNRTRQFGPHSNANRGASAFQRDWAVSLGTTGGVAAGMYPAKYVFDVNAAPNCTTDFAVFPVDASTGNTRANVKLTFSTTVGGANAGTVLFSVTPTGQSAVTLTLTASTTLNTNQDFEVFTTASSANADTEATNLAEAINRNLSGVVLGKIVAVASTNTVTVYALTPGTGITMATPTITSEAALTVTTGPTAGTNGSQASLVGFNDLYAGATTPFCTGATYPQYIFSYASGVGPVATSPALSVDGTKVAYIENDPNIGAILHVLTIAKGSTEYGTCTVGGGATAPTCAVHPVIPGSTTGSTGSDYMLPLGLVGLDATTGAAGAIDSYSSPFIDYQNDILYAGDNSGYLYKITPVFKGSNPAHAGGNFPVSVSANILSAPVLDLANTGNIFVGDSSGDLYNYNSGGTHEATLSVGTATGGGVRDAAIVDSTNSVGYVDTPCTSATATEPLLTQFKFTGTTLTSNSSKSLDYDSGTTETGCGNTPALPMYAPALNNTYYDGGITASGAAITACMTNDNGGWYVNLETLEFTAAGALNTTQGTEGYYGFAYNGTNAAGATTCAPLTEFYGKNVAYTPSAVTTATGTPTTVTVTTPTNLFVTGQVVTIAGVTAGSGGCSAAAIADINGEQTITVTSGTVFTFTIPITTGAAGTCGLSTPTATGPTVDYLFMGGNIPAEVYSFTLPMPNSTAASAPAATAATADATGGTSGMIVDNDSTDGEASSIYYGTLSESTACGTAYCAIKLTQAGLN
jgi:hypothetical protein